MTNERFDQHLSVAKNIESPSAAIYAPPRLERLGGIATTLGFTCDPFDFTCGDEGEPS